MQNDYRAVWNNCLKTIKASIPEESFDTWFEPIIPVALQNNVLIIQVPSQFFYEWLEQYYVDNLRKAIYKELGTEGRLEYSIIVDKGNAENRPQTINIPIAKIEYDKQHPKYQANSEQALKRKNEILKEYDAFFKSVSFNENYTFDTLVEGDCNRLARSAGYAVAKKPGITAFNPLMLYGGVGLGKTHLVQAIANHVRSNQPDKIVVYVSSEKFTNQFIEELKNNNLQKLTNFYLQIDILIIDDVQFLSGKEKTQEMFFHIFNDLHQHGKQIIMTSDRPPKELQGLQDRLLSRFKWGLTADLQQPDYETRVAIIQRKLQPEGISLENDIIEYLAHSIDTNVRELEGVIVSLMARSSLERREIDTELVRQTVQHIVQTTVSDAGVQHSAEMGIDTIQSVISSFFKVTLAELTGKSRKKELVVPRQIAMFFCKEFTNFSLKSIGYHFGGRDHSTVIHAVQTISDLCTKDGEIRQNVQQLGEMFKQKAK